MKALVLAVCVVACLCGGCQKAENDVFKTIDRKVAIYYGSDKEMAATALVELIDYLANAQRSVETARLYDYDKLLGMQWLRLWSTYENRSPVDARRTMDEAIKYFDKDRSMSADARYLADKERALRQFLEATERASPPLWKKRVETQERVKP